MEYIEEVEEMFATEGWKLFVKEAEEAVEQRKDLLTRAGNIESVCYLQGEINQLRTVINMEAAIKLIRQQQEASEEETEDSEV